MHSSHIVKKYLCIYNTLGFPYYVVVFAPYSAAIEFYSHLLHFLQDCHFKTGYYIAVLVEYCDSQPGCKTTETDKLSSLGLSYVIRKDLLSKAQNVNELKFGKRTPLNVPEEVPHKTTENS